MITSLIQALHFVTKPLVIFLTVTLIGIVYIIIGISNELDDSKLYIKYLEEIGIDCNKYETGSIHRKMTYYECNNGEAVEPWSLTDEQHIKLKQFKQNNISKKGLH